MADFAVIKIAGAQYKVSKDDTLTINKTDVTDPEVLLVSVGDKVSVGQPTVAGAKVKLEIIEQKKGKKLDVIKFKAKSRYRRKIGFRAQLTKVKVVSISAS